MRFVLMVSYDFPPSPEVGAQACAQIARHLPAYGWMPTVLTAPRDATEPNHATVEWDGPGTVVSTPTLPHPLSRYRMLKARRETAIGKSSPGEQQDTRRTFAPLRRGLVSLLSVPDDLTGWILPAIFGGLRVIQRRSVDHVFSTAPHWSNHLVGLGLARVTGLPWSVYFRDPWTQWTARPSEKIGATIERRIIRRANSVVCATARYHVAVELFRRCETAGGENTRELATRCGISDCVRWPGPVSRQRVLRGLVDADLLLILAEGWTLQIPQKTYEYLRAGRPILAFTGEGALADLLHRTGGADVVDPTKHEQIFAAIQRIYQYWREGKTPPAPDPTLIAEFDRRMLAKRFARVFEGLVEPS